MLLSMPPAGWSFGCHAQQTQVTVGGGGGGGGSTPMLRTAQCLGKAPWPVLQTCQHALWQHTILSKILACHNAH